jgi:DNA-binding MarR family transcriptional regulator
MDGENGTLQGLELDVWRTFMRAYATLSRELGSELDGSDRLPLRSFMVLLELDQAPERRMRMSDLANAVGLSRSGLSRLIDRLERARWIARAECDDDARGSFAVLTADGVKRLASAQAAHAATVRRLFLDHFTAAELRDLSGYMERVQSA